jgi:tripartite-type tricarboxylate transporter receptor subunit TctC
MKLPRRKFLQLAISAGALPAVGQKAWAQAYPARAVRVVVPVAAGGGNDVTGRIISQWLRIPTIAAMQSN